eukprot:13325005-Heterocapsa_arctica.AAC.3
MTAEHVPRPPEGPRRGRSLGRTPWWVSSNGPKIRCPRGGGRRPGPRYRRRPRGGRTRSGRPEQGPTTLTPAIRTDGEPVAETSGPAGGGREASAGSAPGAPATAATQSSHTSAGNPREAAQPAGSSRDLSASRGAARA